MKERTQVVQVAMPYTTIPKRFRIEMVHCVIILVNSLPCKRGLHSILSPREIVTGNKFRCPKVRVGQYVQGLVGGTNDKKQERLIDALYLGRADNGSGHSVFKLDTKSVVSVNKVVIIPTPQAVIDRINQIRVSEKQPEGIHFLDKDGKVTIHDVTSIDS